MHSGPLQGSVPGRTDSENVDRFEEDSIGEAATSPNPQSMLFAHNCCAKQSVMHKDASKKVHEELSYFSTF